MFKLILLIIKELKTDVIYNFFLFCYKLLKYIEIRIKFCWNFIVAKVQKHIGLP